MSNQIPDTPWGKPASPSSPQPGISRVNESTTNPLADALDERAEALTNCVGEGAAMAAQAKIDILAAAQGYPIGGDLITAIEKAGTALDAALGRLAKTAKSDAQTVRTHVSGRKDTEKDTEKALDDASAPEGTTYV